MNYKVKTLVKLNSIREQPAKIYINDPDGKEYVMTVDEYLTWKESEIGDWVYISGNPEENTEDKLIIYIS